MKEECKPKLMIMLAGVQFVLSAIIIALQVPALYYLKKHTQYDRLLHGTSKQDRMMGSSKFCVHLGANELVLTAGVAAMSVFVTGLLFIAIMGLEKIKRKIRNPLTARTPSPLSNPNSQAHPALKMVIFHPRVLISAALLFHAFFSVMSCVEMFISNALSDRYDYDKYGMGENLGSFTLEQYVCSLMPTFALQHNDMMTVMALHDKCLTQQVSRYLTIVSAALAIIEFFNAVWVLDAISQPIEAPSESSRVRAWLEQRHERASRIVLPTGNSSTENGVDKIRRSPKPEVERVKGRF